MPNRLRVGTVVASCLDDAKIAKSKTDRRSSRCVLVHACGAPSALTITHRSRHVADGKWTLFPSAELECAASAVALRHPHGFRKSFTRAVWVVD